MYKNEDDEPVGGMNAFSIILEARGPRLFTQVF